YLINLGNPDPSLWAQAVTAFTDELERAEALGLSCVVVHPGSHMGAGLEAGLGRVTAALDQSLARTAGYRVKVALENTAGAANPSGGRHALGLGRFGLCSTGHPCAAGPNVSLVPRAPAPASVLRSLPGLRGLGGRLGRSRRVGGGVSAWW